MDRPTLWKDKYFQFPKSLEDKKTFLNHLSIFPSRCSLLINEIPAEKLTKRTDGKWSIQEHLGHLLDMEELPAIRIKEILSGEEILTPADMENKKTWDAEYNKKNVYKICERFMQGRGELVEQFRSVPEGDWLKSAHHERLNRQMSILDLAYFQCEHDQYHYDVIAYLKNMD